MGHCGFFNRILNQIFIVVVILLFVCLFGGFEGWVGGDNVSNWEHLC